MSTHEEDAEFSDSVQIKIKKEWARRTNRWFIELDATFFRYPDQPMSQRGSYES
jgi:hypothetical protein